MAEHSEVLFGTFTTGEVLALYRDESLDLKFGWQRKKSYCLENSLLATPEKLTPRTYSLGGGGKSPQYPKNPPTTPVSELNSRGTSPNPIPPSSRLNANAPPFIPSSSPEPSSPGNESETTSSMEHRPSSDDIDNDVIDDNHVATPTTQVPTSLGLEITEGSSTPIQTVGVPTPFLPSMNSDQHHNDNDMELVRSQHTPAGPPISTDITTPSSPSALTITHHQPHTSPDTHSHTSPSNIVDSTLSPNNTSHLDTTQNTTNTSTSDNITHHTTTTTTTTTTNTASNKTKTWASIVSRNDTTMPVLTQQPISTPITQPTTTSVVNKENKTEDVVREMVKDGEERDEIEKCTVEEDNERASSTTSAHLKSLGEQLKQLNVSHSPISLQPRGLINHGNWCYMHAPLQALINVPEVCHLLRELNPDPPLSLHPTTTPLTDTLTEFIRQFNEYQPQKNTGSVWKKKRAMSDIIFGPPFTPNGVYQLLHKIQTSISTKGRQEDAEEFLCCILSGLHEEMVAAQTAVRYQGRKRGEMKEGGEGGGEGDWEQVGPKNKSTITRQTLFNDTPISEVFGGELRCVVQRQGAKESAIVEPFFSLQLDIQSKDVWSLQDALLGLGTREAVQMNSGTVNEIDVHRRQSLARLPGVLVLHLKRFLFDKTGGSQKLMKHVTYDLDLEIERDLLAPGIRNKLTNAQRLYRLWAVVYHHGKSSVGGHYTCDIHHSGTGGWLRIDDSFIKPVTEDSVLRQSQGSNKVAYLFFYRRSDFVQTLLY